MTWFYVHVKQTGYSFIVWSGIKQFGLILKSLKNRPNCKPFKLQFYMYVGFSSIYDKYDSFLFSTEI